MSESAENMLYWKEEAANADNGFDKAYCTEMALSFARYLLDTDNKGEYAIVHG